MKHLPFLIILMTVVASCAEEPEPAVPEKQTAVDFGPVFFKQMEQMARSIDSTFFLPIISVNGDSLADALRIFPGPKQRCLDFTEWKSFPVFGETFSGRQVRDHTYQLACKGDTVFVWFPPHGGQTSMLNGSGFKMLSRHTYSTCDEIRGAIHADSTELSMGITLSEDASEFLLKYLDFKWERVVLCEGDTMSMSMVRSNIYVISNQRVSGLGDEHKRYVFVANDQHVIVGNTNLYNLVVTR